MFSNGLHPISAVVNLTGLTEFVLRAWEKRYNAVTPVRTPTNRRLYSNSDVEKLKLLKLVTQNGYSIANVAGMSIDNLNDLISGTPVKNESRLDQRMETVEVSELCRNYFEECMQGIQNFHSHRIETALINASLELTHPLIIQDLIIPILIRVGHLWSKGELRIAHEHFATEILRRYLTNLIESIQNDDSAPVMILTTPAGQLHEFGALIAAVYAAAEGWKAYYLGPNLPADEIGATVLKLNAKAVFLSIVYPHEDPKLNWELTRLRKIIPDKVSILAGGNATIAYSRTLNSINAAITNDNEEFKNKLRAISRGNHN